MEEAEAEPVVEASGRGGGLAECPIERRMWMRRWVGCQRKKQGKWTEGERYGGGCVAGDCLRREDDGKGRGGGH